MDIHVCKQCGRRFAYCRACVLKPSRCKDLGFCSVECYRASQIKEVVSQRDVEVVIKDDKDMTIS
jgi:hypothetical protein